jgi:hypothetical protein
MIISGIIIITLEIQIIFIEVMESQVSKFEIQDLPFLRSSGNPIGHVRSVDSRTSDIEWV